MSAKYRPNGSKPTNPDNTWNTSFPEPRAWALNWDGDAIGYPAAGTPAVKPTPNRDRKHTV